MRYFEIIEKKNNNSGDETLFPKWASRAQKRLKELLILFYYICFPLVYAFKKSSWYN